MLKAKINLTILHSVLFLLLCHFIIFPSNVFATKITGTIKGKVIAEATQQLLPAANIVIEGTQWGAATDLDGNFIIKNIPAGKYNLRFRMMGYETRIISNVSVTAERTTYLNIELKTTVLETEDVVVTAGYFYEAKNAVISNRSMDFEEIRSDPGSAEDVQRVVQALPSVVSGSDQDNEIIVRGGMPGENLFIMDNIEIPNPNHFGFQGTSGGPINMVNTYFVRRVDFYAGAFPAQYGDIASSVMDLSLREGNRESYSGNFYLGMAGVGAMAEGPIASGKGSWLFSARKSFLDLIISSTGLTAVPKYYSIQGKGVYNLSSKHKLIINGIFGDDKIKIEDDEESGYDRGAENVESKSYQYAVGATLRSLFSKNVMSNLTIYQTHNNWDQYVYRDNKEPYYLNVSNEIERAIKYDFTFLPKKSLELNFGAAVKAIAIEHDIWAEADTIFIYNTTTRPHRIVDIFSTFPETVTKHDDSIFKYAGYLQTKFYPIPKLTVTAGVRYDYMDYIKKSAVDPRLGFSYQLTPKFSINCAVGQQSQSPAYIQLTANAENNKLDYKRTQQIVFGFETLLREDIKSTLEFFYKDYRKVPISSAWKTPDPFDRSQGRLLSAGKGYAEGVEFFIQKKMSNNYYFTVSYAYSISKGFDPRFDEYYNWDYDYRHILTLINGKRFELRKKQWYQNYKESFIGKAFGWLLPFADEVDISLRWRYLGGRPRTEQTYKADSHYWYTDETTPINNLRYPKYHRLDLRIDQRYMFSGWNIVAYFDMMNVYNRDNIWGYSYKDDGTIDEILQWKVFPVGGFTIEF